MENDDSGNPAGRDDSAQSSLSAIAAARAAAADRLVTPWWYHPALGVAMGGYVIAVSLGSKVVQMVAVVGLLAVLAVLSRTYQRLTGVWIWGFSAGAASRWAYALGGVIGIALITSMVVAATTSLLWPTLVLAVIGTVAIIVLGRRFDEAVRRQLRGRP